MNIQAELKIAFVTVAILLMTAINANASEPFELSDTFRQIDQRQTFGSLYATPDDRYLMSIFGGVAFTWDVQTRKLLTEIDLGETDEERLTAHGFLFARKSRDGKQSSIELLPPAATKSKLLLQLPDDPNIQNCWLSRSGEIVVVHTVKHTHDSDTLIFYEVKSGNVIAKIKSPEESSYSVCWLEQEAKILISFDQELRVFSLDGQDARTPSKPITTSNLHGARIQAMTMTSDGDILVSDANDKLKIYKYSAGKLNLHATLELPETAERLSAIDQSPHVVAYWDGSSSSLLSYVNVLTQEQLLLPWLRSTTRCFFHKKMAYFEYQDEQIRSYSLENAIASIAPIARTPKEFNSITKTYYGSVCFGGSAKELIRSSEGGFSRWRIDSGEITTVGNHLAKEYEVEKVEYLHQATGDMYWFDVDDSLYAAQWDSESERIICRLLLKFPGDLTEWRDHRGTCLQFRNPASDEYNLAVLDAKGVYQSKLRTPEGESMDAATVSADGSLVAFRDDNDIILCEISGNELLQKDNLAFGSPKFNADATKLVCGVTTIEIGTGAVETVYPFGNVTAFDVSSTSLHAVYGHNTGQLFLLDLATQEIAAFLGWMPTQVQSVCFSDDGTKVVAMDKHGVMAVWDLTGFVENASVTPTPAVVDSVALPMTFQRGGVDILIESTRDASRSDVSAALRELLRKIEHGSR
jgi:WD40 repeat protein